MCVCQSKTGGWCQDRLVKKQAKIILWEVRKKDNCFEIVETEKQKVTIPKPNCRCKSKKGS